VVGCEADHSPSSSVKVENSWSYTSTPINVFTIWFLNKHKDFTFMFDIQDD
jgi:hypothetical protein